VSAEAAERLDVGRIKRRDELAVALEVVDLKKYFGGVHAVDGASFEVEAGAITGLIGPNGAGKSTLIDVVAGFQNPTAGRVIYRGQDIASWPAHRVARAGMIRTFQLSSEFARLSVMENLLAAMPAMRGATIGGALRGRRYWRKAQEAGLERGYELLKRFGLEGRGDDYAGELSGGQKRLLEIARAVAARPQLLLLDEPFAGVNPTLAREVESVVLSLRDDGLTIVLVEHDMGAVDRLCDDVVVMADGRALARGTMAEISANQEVADAYLGG
jgi:branched-chain amino acid transport system ATP-binding protein/branched-chain amino acid transport system permease protein